MELTKNRITGIRFAKEELENIIGGFRGRKVLVIGDVMLDAYWWGKVERISPEAPVPIVNVSKRENRLGGAANVALNLCKLGAAATLCSVIGKDMEGEMFLELSAREGISTAGIVTSEERPTTVKTRIIGNKSQLLRVDSEEEGFINEHERQALTERILGLLPDAELVIFEDYDKGVISPQLISDVVEAAKALGVPVVVDPKKRNFLHYKQVTIFKPNLRELSEGLKLDLDGHSAIEEIEQAARILLQQLDSQYALITLSERGVLMLSEKESWLIPAHIRNIFDVSGAGDTVVSVAALSYLAQIPAQQVAALANLAGGLVCEKLGVVPISREELLQEAVQEFVKE